MASERILIDRRTLQWLHGQFSKGRIDLSPSYQREPVWNDEKKVLLIESIMDEFPLGLAIFHVVKKPDADGEPLDHFNVVDGKQRLTTIFEYLNGVAAWASGTKKVSADFRPFRQLSHAQQSRFEEYQLPIAFLNEFEPDEIDEVFSRLQNGMALKMGEKLKALTTGANYDAVRQIAHHEIFDLTPALKNRAQHWTLAATFLRSAASQSVVVRVEFQQMKEFITTAQDEAKVQKSFEETKRALSLLRKIIREAEAIDPDCNFLDVISAARTMKWLFVVLVRLGRTYALTGRETSLASAFIDYYEAVKVRDSVEWRWYLETGRTGRLDTDSVKRCLTQIESRAINIAELVPVDPKRFFTVDQRKQLFEASNGKCVSCGTAISLTNFHADHIEPHTRGGKTTLENGQALCTGCNVAKGAH